GGGDVDLAVGRPDPGTGATTNPPTLAFSSLVLSNISVGKSTDKGVTFTKNPLGNVPGGAPIDDRQWQEFYGQSSGYLLYRTDAPLRLPPGRDGQRREHLLRREGRRRRHPERHRLRRVLGRARRLPRRLPRQGRDVEPAREGESRRRYDDEPLPVARDRPDAGLGRRRLVRNVERLERRRRRLEGLLRAELRRDLGQPDLPPGHGERPLHPREQHLDRRDARHREPEPARLLPGLVRPERRGDDRVHGRPQRLRRAHVRDAPDRRAGAERDEVRRSL